MVNLDGDSSLFSNVRADSFEVPSLASRVSSGWLEIASKFGNLNGFACAKPFAWNGHDHHEHLNTGNRPQQQSRRRG